MRVPWNKLEPEEKARRNQERCARYREANREKVKENARAEYRKNRETFLARKKADYQKNKEKRLASTKAYALKNKEKMRIAKVKWSRNQMLVNCDFRIKKNMRERIRNAVKHSGAHKHFKAEDAVGCGVDDLKRHLESKFKEGMTWENYGKWHIDHVLPCASFNLLDPSEQRRCFHFSNLQPLWAKENLAKGSKMINGSRARFHFTLN